MSDSQQNVVRAAPRADSLSQTERQMTHAPTAAHLNTRLGLRGGAESGGSSSSMRRLRTGVAIGAIFAAAAVSCAAPAAATATTLFSNITGQPTVSSGTTVDTVQSNSWVAKKFTPTASGTVGVISFWVQCFSGAPDQQTATSGVKIALVERERFADPQPDPLSSPRHDPAA